LNVNAGIATAVRLSEAAEGSEVPVWVFGVGTFGALVLLLVITMMLKVGR
jgi:hypothetical protein